MLWAHVHRHYAWRERVFPSYARIAEETGQSESAVKRQLNALKAVGAITWGATYGARGRSSNSYALAVVEPFRFDRDTAGLVQVKNDLHPSVQVKNEPPVQVKSDRHPQVKNDLGVKSSSYLESTDESLSPPPSPELGPATPEASSERETIAAPDNHDTDTAVAVVAAYTQALHRPVTTSTRTNLHQQATQLLADGFPSWWLADRARELAGHGWTDLAKHAARSTVPTTRTAPDGREPWCGHCGDPTYRMVKDPARDYELVECGACHPAACARRRRAQAGEAA
jgi:hypothetical protein